MLYNLVSNGVKFTGQAGTVEIMISLTEDSQICLIVKDNGIGIKQEDFSRLFVEFQQLDSGTDRHYQGTGLGLALTKKIIELQKDTISLASEVGKGTTFTVILPNGGNGQEI